MTTTPQTLTATLDTRGIEILRDMLAGYDEEGRQIYIAIDGLSIKFKSGGSGMWSLPVADWEATPIKESIEDVLHGRRPGDVLVHLQSKREYVVVSVSRSKGDEIGYDVRPCSNPDAPVQWMSHFEFHKP